MGRTYQSLHSAQKIIGEPSSGCLQVQYTLGARAFGDAFDLPVGFVDADGFISCFVPFNVEFSLSVGLLLSLLVDTLDLSFRSEARVVMVVAIL